MLYIVVYTKSLKQNFKQRYLSKISQCDHRRNLDKINAAKTFLLSGSLINWDSE